MNIHPTSTIDPSARLYGKNIEVGPNTRIDAFCVLSAGPGGITIGANIHISCGVYLFGSGGRIVLEDYTFLSSHSVLYTATDDQGGNCLVGPQCPEWSRRVIKGDITIRRGGGIGAGAIVLPGVTIGEGATLGALSIAKKDIPPFAVAVGPDQRIVRYKNGDTIRHLLDGADREVIQTREGIHFGETQP